jgi:autotransporter-associated beta strand protein
MIPSNHPHDFFVTFFRNGVLFMRSYRAFYRASSIVALLAIGVCLSSQIATADSFDWQVVNGLNWNTPVESQFGGTCWNFSACGTLEAKYKLTRNDPVFNDDVSEQEVDWEGYMGSTGGGNGEAVLTYFTTHGVVSASECPTQGTDVGSAPYWPLASGWQNRVFKSTSNVNQITNVTATMKLDLKMYGPMEVGCTASNDLYTSVADLETNYRAPVNSEDHEVSLVGYVDDSKVPSGGYWIIKNSWGYGDNTLYDYGNDGYYIIPYGNLEIHNDISAITGAVYYTGAMLSQTWTGSASNGPIWVASTNSKYYNFTGGVGWVNQETAATFDSSSNNRTISIINTVIAHQLTFGTLSSGSNYTFNNGGSGALTVTAGGIQAHSSATINVPVTIGAPQTWTTDSGMTLNVTAALHTIISDLTISGAGSTIIGGPIDGGGVLNTVGGAAPGNLIKSGTGTLTLSGASNYSGNITVSAGVLNLAPVSGATATYSGAISGTASLQKNDQGTVILSAANPSFSGAVTVNQGQLTLNNSQALGTNSTAVTISGGQLNYNVAGTVTRPFTINNGGILNEMAASGVYSGTITCTGAAQISCSGGALTLSSAISGNMGGNGLTFNGVSGNTITLNGNLSETNSSGVTFSNGTTVLGGSANTYAGATTISNGTLTPTKASNLPSATNVTLSAGTLNLNGYSQSIASITSLVPASDLVTSAGSCTLTVSPTSNTTYAGQLSGPINLTKNGSSTFVLSGNNALSASVTTTISAGTLQIGGGGTTGSLQGNVTDNGVLVFARSDSVTFGGNISGASGSFVQQGPGLLALTGTNSYGGGTTINGGTLQIGGGGAAGTISGNVAVNAGTLAFCRSDNVVFAGAISGAAGSFDNEGSGTLALTGTNSYGGGTTINNGTLQIGNGGAAGTITGNVAVNAGTLAFSRSDNVTFAGNISGAGSVVKQGTNTLTLTGANSCAALTVNGGALQIGNGGTTGSISGNVAVSSGTLSFSRSDDASFGGNISGAGSVVKQGTNTLTLTGANNCGGGTTINGGTLQVGNGGTTGSIAGNVTINSGTLAFARADDVSFGGNISGCPGSVVKQGTNTLVLTGTNTYCGGTIINGGTLQIGNGGTTGFIAGAVTVNSGTLAFARSDDTGFSGAIGGGGGVLKYCANRLTLSGPNTYSGPTIVAGGTLELGPSAQSCVLNGGGLDIQAGKVVFDYAGGADPIATIQSLVNASYDCGKWDVGQFRDSTATASGLTLGLLDNTSASTVTVMATYPGDFNLDGVVDNLDRQVWFANAFSGTTWQQGDANHDGVVNDLDRDVLFSNAGCTAPVTSMMPAEPASSMAAARPGTVPEPGTLALLAAGLIGLLAYGWKKGK